MGETRSVHVRITGRVQGVGYRAWLEAEAVNQDLDGWVRNHTDGTVEAVFRGAPNKVAEMLERCRSGPPAARVTRIDTLGAPREVSPGFHRRATV